MSEREIVITVPLAPPRALLPNVRRKGKGGSHWSEQADETQALRWAAKAAAINALTDWREDERPIFTTPVTISYAVIWPQSRYGARKPIPDHDAIPSAAKSILDGFVDAGVLVDDSVQYVAEVRAMGRRGEIDEDGQTVVTIAASGLSRAERTEGAGG